eukprot:scaffold81102_cov32-Tisochrysis_lutea.AAC.4
MPRKPHMRSSAQSNEPTSGGSPCSSMFSSSRTTSAGTASPSGYERSGKRRPSTTSTKALRSSRVRPIEHEASSASR